MRRRWKRFGGNFGSLVEDGGISLEIPGGRVGGGKAGKEKRKEEGRKEKEAMFALRLFLKWAIFLLFKSAIELPVIVFGPLALIGLWVGWDFAALEDRTVITAVVTTKTAFFCCLFCIVCIPDWIVTILLPWKGGQDCFPIWWEDDQSLLEKIREHDERYT